MDRVLKLLAWPAALFIAYIFLWYEQYKLTGDPGSVELFTILTNGFGLNGYEKPVRLGVATAEITASILVVLPWTRVGFGHRIDLRVQRMGGPIGVQVCAVTVELR